MVKSSYKYSKVGACALPYNQGKSLNMLHNEVKTQLVFYPNAVNMPHVFNLIIKICVFTANVNCGAQISNQDMLIEAH